MRVSRIDEGIFNQVRIQCDQPSNDSEARLSAGRAASTKSRCVAPRERSELDAGDSAIEFEPGVGRVEAKKKLET